MRSLLFGVDGKEELQGISLALRTASGAGRSPSARSCYLSPHSDGAALAAEDSVVLEQSRAA